MQEEAAGISGSLVSRVWSLEPGQPSPPGNRTVRCAPLGVPRHPKIRRVPNAAGDPGRCRGIPERATYPLAATCSGVLVR